MAGRKSSRTADRVTTQKPERKSGILSPHDELRERLLETAIDVKENIPERRRSSRNTSVGSQKSDCSESRKRHSTKDGPAAKRHSGEKCRNESREDSMDFMSDFSDDRDVSSSSSNTQPSRVRGKPLPVMPEEEEVFDSSSDNHTESERSHEMVRSRDGRSHNINDDESSFDENEEEEFDDEAETENEEDLPVQNREFADMKRLMNDSTTIDAPLLLSTTKCDGIGSPSKVWSLMVKRDDIPRATQFLLRNHPQMTTSMRLLLVDWMMEVCESERLHRETFHLAVDYVDRYLENAMVECSQESFQLVGTAALFIAAKYEEIYPPKCADFSSLTDGAFSPQDIREMEIVIVKDIGWSLGPITSIHWLSTYLQLLGTNSGHLEEHCDEGNMYVPEFLRVEYIEMCKILDYLLFEVESFNYTYRTLAAAVLFVNYEPVSAVEQATGFLYDQMGRVIEYVEPVCRAFAQQRGVSGEIIPDLQQIKSDDSHNIQVHINHNDIEDFVDRERERCRQRKRHQRLI